MYVTGTTFIRYVTGTTFIRYVTGTTFIRYVTGTTFIRYVTGTTFIRYVSGTTFIRYVSGTTFIRYAQRQNIGESNNLKVFRSKKTKGSKQKDEIELRSHMREGVGLPISIISISNKPCQCGMIHCTTNSPTSHVF
jgi:hypothetical protein